MACISPFFNQVKGQWMPFPCGRCPPCKKRRVDGWVFRMLQEDKRSTHSHFITLTYDNAHVPISPNGHLTLVKDEFPRYMKRLRKLCPKGVRLKYYACGEYGSDFARPHYHAIVFNCPNPELFYKAWHLDGVPIGIVDVGNVSSDSIAYTTGYINKRGGFGRGRRDDDRLPEFSLMSKGLGSNYVTKSVIQYHKADLSRNHLTKPGGDIIAMPRYYRDIIFDKDEQSIQQGLAEVASGVSNSEKYDRYLRLYGDSADFSFDRYLEAERLGVVNKFYNNQKVRK